MGKFILICLLCGGLWYLTDDDNGIKNVVRGVASELAQGASDIKTGATRWLVDHTPKD